MLKEGTTKSNVKEVDSETNSLQTPSPSPQKNFTSHVPPTDLRIPMPKVKPPKDSLLVEQIPKYKNFCDFQWNQIPDYTLTNKGDKYTISKEFYACGGGWAVVIKKNGAPYKSTNPEEYFRWVADTIKEERNEWFEWYFPWDEEQKCHVSIRERWEENLSEEERSKGEILKDILDGQVVLGLKLTDYNKDA